MRAVLWFDPQTQFKTDDQGKIAMTFDSTMLTRGATKPGRFLLEVGDDAGGRFNVDWGFMPSVPLNLVAFPGPLYVSLQWDKPTVTNGTVTYNVYRALSATGPWTTIVTGWSYQPDPGVHPERYGLQDSPLTPGVTYYYKVSGVNSYGEGPKAGPVHAMPYGAATIPVTPSYFHTIWDPNFLFVTATWDTSQQHLGETYKVYVSYDGSSYHLLQSGIAVSPTAFAASVEADFIAEKDIWMYVTTLSADGFTETAHSPVWHLIGNIAPVWGIATAGTTSGEITLNWAAPVNLTPPDGYTLAYAPTGSAVGAYIYLTLSTALTIVITDLTSGTQYDFVLQANYNATSTNDETVSLATIKQVTPYIGPGAPVLSGTVATNECDLSWTGPTTGTFTPFKFTLTQSVGGTVIHTFTDITNSYFFDFTVSNGTTYTYQVQAIDSKGNAGVLSNIITLTPAAPITAPPIVSGQPTSVAVTVGNMVALSVTVTGVGPFTYSWYKSPSTLIQQAVGVNTLTLYNAQTSDGGVYYVTITNAGGSTQSFAVVVLVVAKTGFYMLNAGSNSVLYVWVNPAMNPSYPITLWTLYVTVNGLAQSPTSYPNGTNTSTHGYSPGDVVSAYVSARVDATGYGVGVDSPSDEQSLTIVNPTGPTIDVQPVTQTVQIGSDATFSVVAHGSGTLSYQWYHQASAVGTDSTSYTLTNAQFSDVGSVWVIVTDSTGATQSDVVNLNVNALPPTITTQPHNVTVYVGQSATLTIAAIGNGNNLTYQWKFNNVAIVGATNTFLTIPNLTTDQRGNYSCDVSNNVGVQPHGGGGTVTSAAVVITVYATFNFANSWDVWTAAGSPFALGPAATYSGLTIRNSVPSEPFAGAISHHCFYTGTPTIKLNIFLQWTGSFILADTFFVRVIQGVAPGAFMRLYLTLAQIPHTGSSGSYSNNFTLTNFTNGVHERLTIDFFADLQSNNVNVYFGFDELLIDGCTLATT